jgi:hypothetical protein
VVNDGIPSNHGSQGIWYKCERRSDGNLLKQADTTLTRTMPAGATTAGVMYDDLRLELDENAT